MSFINKLGKKLGEATQTATKKSSELMETTKLNSEIKSERNKINKYYLEIGKKVYETYNEDDKIFEGFEELLDEINNSKSKIQELNERLLAIKNIKTCSNCGHELPKESTYCDKCGAKQELVDENKEENIESDEEE